MYERNSNLRQAQNFASETKCAIVSHMPDSNGNSSSGSSLQVGTQGLSGFCVSTCEDGDRPVTIESMQICKKESNGEHIPMFREPNPIAKGWEWNVCKLCRKNFPVKPYGKKA
jgi:hypothetical protein